MKRIKVGSSKELVYPYRFTKEGLAEFDAFDVWYKINKYVTPDKLVIHWTSEGKLYFNSEADLLLFRIKYDV